MPEIQTRKECLFCHRDDSATPLLVLEYRGSNVRICPQHMPVLIHDPQKLVGLLPGAENLSPAEISD
jgi:hypothetical protein